MSELGGRLGTLAAGLWDLYQKQLQSPLTALCRGLTKAWLAG